MPLFLESPNHDPRGPDGGGWNRLSLNVAPGAPQCALRPTSFTDLREAANTRLARYGNFGRCDGPALKDRRCGKCPRQDSTFLGAFEDAVMVRVDEHGKPWLMNKPEDGWASFGYERDWAFIASLSGWVADERLQRDAHGQFLWLRRA